MRSSTARRSASIALLIAGCGVGFCQGAQAVSIRESIATQIGQAGFDDAWRAGLSKISSLEDALWLLGSLVKDARVGASLEFLYSERASLLELAGRYGEAAADWEAASSKGSDRSAEMLVQAAACRLAAGEDKAAAALSAKIAAAYQGSSWAAIAAVISAWASYQGGEGLPAAFPAAALTEHRDPRVAASALVLIAYASEASDRDKAKAHLRERFPALSKALETVPSHLVLATALRSTPSEPARAASTAGSTAATPQTDRAAPKEPAPEAKSAERGASVYYQVGAFRDKENADAAIERIKKLGVAAFLKYKDDRKLYIVYVGAGADADKTILALKDAGFEAFRLDRAP